MTERQLREKVVSVMRGWLGWSKTNGKHKKIVDLYNNHKPLARGYKVKYTDEWCATTVSAASIQCGLTDIMPTECSCPKMAALYQKMGRWQENDAYRPAPGDIIMYHWQDGANYAKTDCTGSPNHVGIVEKVVGNVITVIEGNKGNAVARRTVNVNGRYIRGYCLPDYASKATADKPTETGGQKLAGAKSFDASAKSGIRFTVNASVLNVRSSASAKDKSNILRTVQRGDVVKWYGFYTGDFYLVQMADKTTGYVHKDYLTRK